MQRRLTSKRSLLSNKYSKSFHFSADPSILPKGNLPRGKIDRHVSIPMKSNTNASFQNTIYDVVDDLASPVLLICINYGFLDFLHNLMFSMSRLKLQPNILIICEDTLIYSDLSKQTELSNISYHLAITHLNKSGYEASQWKSDGYIYLVRKRPHYIKILLSRGLDLFYVDTDIVLLGNPFPFFNGSSDLFVQQELESENLYCAGFFYIRSNIRTIAFANAWATAHIKGRRGIQRSFNDVLMLYDDISVTSLPTDQFCSGSVFFSSEVPWQDRYPPVIEVHANFIAGYENKKEKLARAGLWFIKD